MAKRTRSGKVAGGASKVKAPASAAAAATGEASPPPPPPPPPVAAAAGNVWTRFWAYEVSWLRWCTFRFAFFALLSIDAFLQISHASRYGAGGFNVQHLPGAPLPGPGRASITFAHAAMCLLFALIAQGVLVRFTLPLATVLYGWAYFSSQLDAFQHHYLVWLLLFVLCFVPSTPDPVLPGAAPFTPRRMTSWALRLALVQVGIVYLWAAISKLTPLWLDGTALDIQISKPGLMRDVADALGVGTLAKLVLVTELALAAAVWWRPAWPFALAAGVGLHAGVELVDLDIGLFSYLMFAVYLLVVPDRFYLAAGRALGPYLRRDGGPLSYRAGWVLAPFALIGLYVTVPLPFGLPVLLAFGLLVAAGAFGKRWAGWAFVLAAAIPITVDATTDTASDYYRYWAGSSRRMGDAADARRAYEGLLEVDADSEYANYHLGNQELDAGRLDSALRYYQRAERGAGKGRTRAFVAEASIHLRREDLTQARVVLERALRIDPADADAQRMLAGLDTAGGAPPPTPHGPAEAPDED